MATLRGSTCSAGLLANAPSHFTVLCLYSVHEWCGFIDNRFQLPCIMPYLHTSQCAAEAMWLYFMLNTLETNLRLAILALWSCAHCMLQVQLGHRVLLEQLALKEQQELQQVRADDGNFPTSSRSAKAASCLQMAST